MANYDDQFADAAAQLVDDLADTVQYSPDGSSPQTVVAIVGREETRMLVEQDGIKSRYVRTVGLPRSTQAAGGGAAVAELRLHDQLTYTDPVYGELLYTVEAIVSQSVNWTVVEAHRLATREKTRQGFRRT